MHTERLMTGLEFLYRLVNLFDSKVVSTRGLPSWWKRLLTGEQNKAPGENFKSQHWKFRTDLSTSWIEINTEPCDSTVVVSSSRENCSNLSRDRTIFTSLIKSSVSYKTGDFIKKADMFIKREAILLTAILKRQTLWIIQAAMSNERTVIYSTVHVTSTSPWS